MPTFRVQIIGLDGAVTRESMVTSKSPAEAAVVATGDPALTSASKRSASFVLRAKVYRESDGGPTMRRFYGPRRMKAPRNEEEAVAPKRHGSESLLLLRDRSD